MDDLVSDEVARPNKALQPTQNRRVVIHLMNIQVRPAATTDGPSIEALYSEWGYKSGFSQNDQIFLAQKGEQIVGVVKLTFESNVCVLRGMFIKTELQGKGIGSKLLGSVNEWLGNKQAFCVSFKHLSNFYGQIGFAEISDSEAPDFLFIATSIARRLVLISAQIGWSVR